MADGLYEAVRGLWLEYPEIGVKALLGRLGELLREELAVDTEFQTHKLFIQPNLDECNFTPEPEVTFDTPTSTPNAHSPFQLFELRAARVRVRDRVRVT